MESLRVPRDFKSGSSLLLLLQSKLVHRVTALVEFQAQIRGIHTEVKTNNLQHNTMGSLGRWDE